MQYATASKYYFKKRMLYDNFCRENCFLGMQLLVTVTTLNYCNYFCYKQL